MKKAIYLLLFVAIGFFYSCDDNNERISYTYKINEPVLMDASAFRESVKVKTTPVEITKQGKICFYDGYLYISEPDQGIHIIDNRNPSSPQNVGFIELLGNADLSIRNGTLYADSYVDLVWFDISNPAKPSLKGRLEEVFPYAVPPIPNEHGYDYDMCRQRDGKIVVGWTLKERTEWMDNADGGIYYESANSSKGNGVNGSMSRFGVYKNYLYVVLNSRMTVLDLSAATPKNVFEEYIAWDVETIFSYKDNMFLGTPTGMFIVSVKDPANPEPVSSIQHVYGCDPVVVENDLAYVTVHSGNNCGQGNDELFIVDISDIKKPKQIVSYTMTHPKGLGIDNGTLFVCDDGLKVFDAADPQKLMANMLAHHKGMDGYDVIPSNKTLMMIADDGLYQYDYSDLKNIKLLSKLPIKK